MLTKRLRSAGHSLALRWSGETGAESSSTGFCTCGWSESCSSQAEVRNEYAHHLTLVQGRPFAVVDEDNAATARGLIAERKAKAASKRKFGNTDAAPEDTLYLSAAYTVGRHNHTFIMIFGGRYATDTVYGDRKVLLRNRDYLANVATRKGRGVAYVAASKARAMIEGLEHVGNNFLSAAVRG